jgi:hypothetical protein
MGLAITDTDLGSFGRVYVIAGYHVAGSSCRVYINYKRGGRLINLF